MNQQTKAHPEWRLLLQAFKDSDYGTMIPHEQIEQIVGFDRRRSSSKYYGCVNRWKKAMLREASRQVECENTKGYEIIKPEAFRVSAKKQLKFGNKRIKKAGEIVVNAPISLLTDDEKKKLGDTGIVISQILHFSKATMRKVKEIDKKTDKLLLDVGKALDVSD